ncbi:MAG: 50S ribosomal protein L24 [Firmicutes bacterium]|nr:50S ribosomal protein L24 [Bacillota bacterium]
MHVKKGDKVKIMSGKDRNKTGKVLEVLPRERKVVVEGVNMIKRHQRPTRDNPQGGILEKEAPLYSDKVMVVCAKCKEASRVGYKFLQNGDKVRYCKNCGEVNEK